MVVELKESGSQGGYGRSNLQSPMEEGELVVWQAGPGSTNQLGRERAVE